MWHNPTLPATPHYVRSLEKCSKLRLAVSLHAEDIRKAYGIELSAADASPTNKCPILPTLPECLRVLNKVRNGDNGRDPVALLRFVRTLRKLAPGVLVKRNVVN